MRRLALLALLAPPLAGCIADRLYVDITTRVQPDGSCNRRIEYRLERVDTDKNDTGVPIPPDEDALRLLHRFPSGDPWTVGHRLDGEAHVVEAEAVLASPNDIGWDYWRARAPHGPPTRNYVSFAADTAGVPSVYEYAETFVDPSSPVAALRLLGRTVLKKDGEFASRFRRSNKAPGLQGDVRRAFRETFAKPFAREVASIAGGPVYGPRERKALEGLADRIVALQADLTAALKAMAPVDEGIAVEEGANEAMEGVGQSLEVELKAAGLSLPSLFAESPSRIRFRVTLIMPAPIVRANTCFQGDSVTWEFDQDDIRGGRRFEMWARAEGQ